jgi:hypothetical protein
MNALVTLFAAESSLLVYRESQESALACGTPSERSFLWLTTFTNPRAEAPLPPPLTKRAPPLAA